MPHMSWQVILALAVMIPVMLIPPVLVIIAKITHH
jgi:hypothetical protein